MSAAFSRKHWRQMSRPYLRMIPPWLPQTRLGNVSIHVPNAKEHGDNETSERKPWFPDDELLGLNNRIKNCNNEKDHERWAIFVTFTSLMTPWSHVHNLIHTTYESPCRSCAESVRTERLRARNTYGVREPHVLVSHLVRVRSRSHCEIALPRPSAVSTIKSRVKI